jgi:PAS domain-containing protein
MIKDNSIKLIFIVSLLAAIIFPAVSITYIYPSFTKMLIKNTEDEAFRTGAYLSEILLKDKAVLTVNSITDEFLHESGRLVRNFNLMKMKVLAQTGEILFSTEKREIGQINTSPYFHDIVARGKPYSKAAKKDTPSLEGQTVTADVVETYVPVIKNGKPVGVFELYYDVTERNIELNRKIFLSSIIPLALMLFFLIAIVAVLIRADRYKSYSSSREMSMRYRSPYYSLAMIALSLFIAEMIVMLFISFIPGIAHNLIEAALDAMLLVMIISPTIYFFFVQPLMKYISEHKHAEVALKESQRALAQEHDALNDAFKQVERAKLQWERTMDCVGDIIILADKDGKLQRYNKSLSKLVDKPCRDYLGEKWEKILIDINMTSDELYGKRIEMVQESTGRHFELNTHAFYHSDINLCGTVITIHENTEKYATGKDLNI